MNRNCRWKPENRSNEQAGALQLVSEHTTTTTIFTRHEIRHEGSETSATLMLDDAGLGTVIIATAAGPAFSIDASQLRLFAELFEEADRVQQLLRETVPSDAAGLSGDDI